MKSNKSIAQHTSLHQCGKIRHRYRLIPPHSMVISIISRSRATAAFSIFIVRLPFSLKQKNALIGRKCKKKGSVAK